MAGLSDGRLVVAGSGCLTWGGVGVRNAAMKPYARQHSTTPHPSAQHHRPPALHEHPAFAVPADRSVQNRRLRVAADRGQAVGVVAVVDVEL
ncbi:hypothetical protein [Streptomyces sp. NPDC021622]|uniref:hypothetical protein n=1 Tax=Streptomyces sp. NPDC021622 TaxID=3155013 RepID=UPI00340F2183